jgi:alpha-beta hydrolase superfamily lysophospholipase
MKTHAVASALDGLSITLREWPATGTPRGVVQVAHGLAEHSLRYARLAEALAAAGYQVYASDHRGHGETVNGNVPLGRFGAPGWDGLVADLVQIARFIAQRHERPFLIAHSMGSFATQQALLDHADAWRAVVLSGTTALDKFAEAAAAAPPGTGLTAFNAPFENRTGYEWLSRDAAEVDKYVADPLSGFDVPPETMGALFSSAARTANPAGVRSDLPLLLVSGSADPLAGGGALIELVAQRYRDAGVMDVTMAVYPDARHEVFNETNRDEITRRVIDWLAAH